MKWQAFMTDTAKRDLREIALFLYEQSQEWNVAAALVSELQQQCRTLEAFPERGAIPKDYVLKALGYRYLIYQHYLIFYLMDHTEHKVYIHGFFHEKQDSFQYMRKRI